MNFDNISVNADIRIRRTPSEVCTAFSDASAMSKFWFTRRDDGLIAGEPVTWFIGSGENAIAFEVRLKEIDPPHKIVIAWGHDDDNYPKVIQLFEVTEDGDTRLTIEETGFTGSNEAIIERALDSTGGFNQVIIAAKALNEHGVELNLVADHVYPNLGEFLCFGELS